MHLSGTFIDQIRKFLVMFALILLCPAGISADVYTDSPVLSWARNTEGDLQGYEVYSSGSYDGEYVKANTGIIPDQPEPSWTDESVSYGEIRYYRLLAVDLCGNKSDLSEPSEAVIISNGDFDGDGYSDDFEQTMGTDPLSFNEQPPAISLDLSPTSAEIIVGGHLQLDVFGIFEPPVGDPTDYNMTCIVEYKTSTSGVVLIDSCGHVIGVSEGAASVWAEQTVDEQTTTSNIAVITVRAAPSNVGVFRNGSWFLDFNGDDVWDADDKFFSFGMAGDVPLVGDWNGDGTDDIGVFRDGEWYLDSNGDGEWDEGSDELIYFGLADDIPVAGDWNGDGTDTIGIFRDGYWYLDVNGDGQWDAGDISFTAGRAGDVPLVGDWNGDGTDTVGVFRDGRWYLDVNGNGLWDEGDISFIAGRAGDVPVVGDWNADGIDTIGVFRDGRWYLDVNGNGLWDEGDALIDFGMAGDIPVVGIW